MGASCRQTAGLPAMMRATGWVYLLFFNQALAQCGSIVSRLKPRGSPCPLRPCCGLQEFTELLPGVKPSSPVKHTQIQVYLEPLRYPPGEQTKARTRSASRERISAPVLFLCQFVHRAP